jgi:hypothetical protein
MSSVLFLKARDRRDSGTSDMFATHLETRTRKDGVSQGYHVKQQEPKAKADGKSRAAAGGQKGVNGYHYKGGQFLPSTMAEPGKWKVGKKWVTSGRELVEPGVYGYQPTPFSRSIFSMVNGYSIAKDGKLTLRDGIRDYSGEPITIETKIRPGVKGVLGKEELSYGELIDAYNNGQRWFDVQPDAETMTKAIIFVQP